MKLGIYAIKDTLVGFMTPYCQVNDAYAKRAFQNAAQDVKPNNVNTNPEDKELYFIGSFDESTGTIEPKNPQFLARASEFKKVGDSHSNN